MCIQQSEQSRLPASSETLDKRQIKLRRYIILFFRTNNQFAVLHVTVTNCPIVQPQQQLYLYNPYYSTYKTGKPLYAHKFTCFTCTKTKQVHSATADHFAYYTTHINRRLHLTIITVRPPSRKNSTSIIAYKRPASAIPLK
jgi:hypothetical protein